MPRKPIQTDLGERMSYVYVEDEHNACPTCGGPLLVLGQLHNRLHYRCRNCGYQCSWIVENIIPELYLGTH